MKRILILGGTAEARELAAELHGRGREVITSLAGRVARPRFPVGKVRIGGFGGPDALAAWLLSNEIAAVVDATHAFAERISASAAQAAEQAGMPLLRLERPGWTEGPGDRWHWVDGLDEAAARVSELGSRVLLTTGRQGLSAFAGVGDAWFLIRCVDPPDDPLPPDSEVLLDRGPYTLQGELALIDDHGIDVVVTKDSGGDHTRAKLDAARTRGLPVIVMRRPPQSGAKTVTRVDEVVAWASERDCLLGEVSDPDGRTVVLLARIWEDKIVRDHPELRDQLQKVLETVSAPDHVEPDPRAGRRRYYRRRVGPSNWLLVVVSFEQAPGRIITALATRKDPKRWKP
jgi:precorrin-6A/cobalt-precorrin-6A reductase